MSVLERLTIGSSSLHRFTPPTQSIAPSLVLENCSSIDSNGYLQIDLASDV